LQNEEFQAKDRPAKSCILQFALCIFHSAFCIPHSALSMRAMVLAAGLGTRLGELTREVPKGMLELQGRPLLEYIISHLQRHGFDELVLNLHFCPEMVRSHFDDGQRWDVSIAWSYEPELLGTAGGVKRMESFLREGDAFLIHYGDILTDQDFTAMLRFHRERKALATLLLHRRNLSNSVVELDEEGRIISFLERPSEQERGEVKSDWVNSGICICAPQFLDTIPVGITCDLPRDIFPKLVSSGRLFGFPLSGYRCAIDSPQRLAEARVALAEGKFSPQYRTGAVSV
jgi:NDP-sugar pyrophosphorylase family protein